MKNQRFKFNAATVEPAYLPATAFFCFHMDELKIEQPTS